MNLQSKIQNLYCRMKSMRFLTLLIIWGFMVDDMLRLYRNLAMELNVKDSFAILPFIQNDDFFMKVVLLSVLCFYSNAPFMERNELYFVQRIGKKRWGSRNIFYIFGSSILLAVILVLLSILLNFPAVDFSNSWGSLYRTVSVYGMEKYQIPLVLITLGKDGSRAYYKGMCVEEKGYNVQAVDTTGAGDTFCGSVIHAVLKYGLETLTEEKLREILAFANSAGALVTTKKGALCSIPKQEEIMELMKKEKRI